MTNACYTIRMSNIEHFEDSKGNSITITQEKDGVTVHADIVTLPPYGGGANAGAARLYAAAHGLNKKR